MQKGLLHTWKKSKSPISPEQRRLMLIVVPEWNGLFAPIVLPVEKLT